MNPFARSPKSAVLGSVGWRLSSPPTFRLSILDAAADYIDEGMVSAAERALTRLLDGQDADGVTEWLERLRRRGDSASVTRELRAEVERLRSLGRNTIRRID